MSTAIIPFFTCTIFLFLSDQSYSQQKNAIVKTEIINKMNLAYLFDAKLQYNDNVAVDIPMEGRTGDFIGKGNGTIKGEKISGTVRWQFYAENCAYLWIKKGQEPPPNQHLCKTNPGGIITTNDGAEILFDAKGYGLKGADAKQPHIWYLTAALQFHTEDERYKWLNTTLGVWEGRFDEQSRTANYKAYIQEKTR